MSAAILYTSGDTSYRELSPRFELRDGVWTKVRRWRGTREQLVTVARSLADPNASLQEEDEYWWLLESTSGATEAEDPATSPVPAPADQVVTLWGLSASRISKSIWQHPTIMAEFRKIWGDTDEADIPDDTRQGFARFRADLQALARGEEVVQRISTVGTANGEEVETVNLAITLDGIITTLRNAVPSMDALVLKRFFSCLTRGVESWPLDAFTLVKRAVAPAGATLTSDPDLLNRPVSRATLLERETTIPTAIRSAMPEGYYIAGAPDLDQQDRNRIALVHTWIHADDYDRFVWGTAV